MWSNHKRGATNVTLERRLSKSAKESLMAGEASPRSTTGLDDFEIGEGISPGGNPELLDTLIDLGDESSPRGPGLAPPHTVTSDAMELSAPVLDPGARQHSLQDLDLDLTPKSPSKVQIVLDLEMAEGECKKFPQEPSLADALLVLQSVHAGNALSLEIKPSASPIADVDNLDDEMAAAVNGTHHSDNDDGWDGWPMM